MKKLWTLICLIFLSLHVTSCGDWRGALGANENVENSKARTLTLLENNQVTLVSAPTEFIGTWVGTIDGNVATFIIKPNGTVNITLANKSGTENLVINDNSEYFLTDYEDYEILALEIVTISTITALRITDVSGNIYEVIKT
jgi:hypothetical protein